LCVYELQRTDDGMALQLICEQSLHIQIIRCEVRGDFIVVGDLLRSITLLSYTHQPPELRVVAQDYSTHWTTALTMLNDQAVLAADGCFNLYTVLHRSDETDEDLRQQMQTCGEFHLGDQVNRFCSGK
jgi:DNA damage-binding protein 1